VNAQLSAKLTMAPSQANPNETVYYQMYKYDVLAFKAETWLVRYDFKSYQNMSCVFFINLYFRSIVYRLLLNV